MLHIPRKLYEPWAEAFPVNRVWFRIAGHEAGFGAALKAQVQGRSRRRVFLKRIRARNASEAQVQMQVSPKSLGGRFGYFLLFLVGEGEGGVGAPEGGRFFYCKSHKGGGGVPGGGWSPEGAAANWGKRGGGLIFFVGAETSTKERF